MVSPVSSTKNIKRAQKESVLLRLISHLFIHATIEDSQLQGLMITRVKLSPDKSICTVYFYTPGGIQEFEEKLKTLKLYKPSMRKAIATEIQSRYTVDLVFKYDEFYERQARIEALIDTLQKEK